jgi:transcriptional regulator with XRE-family HTH domain
MTAPTADPWFGDLTRIRKTLADNVRRERVRVGVSQEVLADRCQVRRSTVARIEKAIQEPRVSTLVAISTALEVPLASLMSGLLDPLPPARH